METLKHTLRVLTYMLTGLLVAAGAVMASPDAMGFLQQNPQVLEILTRIVGVATSVNIALAALVKWLELNRGDSHLTELVKKVL